VGMAALVLSWAGFAYADETNSATAHVYVDVVANIAVMAMAPTFDLGSIQTGEFSGTIPFRVDANTEKVRIGAAASNLYKGDEPDTVWVDPILLFRPDGLGGIEILPHNANPVMGGGNFAPFDQPVIIDGFQGFNTGTITFESAQNNHFSQQVDLVVTWTQPDPEKPMGEYSGKVKMTAWIVLPI
jgi:hypothetical protein